MHNAQFVFPSNSNEFESDIKLRHVIWYDKNVFDIYHNHDLMKHLQHFEEWKQEMGP